MARASRVARLRFATLAMTGEEGVGDGFAVIAPAERRAAFAAATGDHHGEARIAIEEAIREAEALPAGQRSQVQVASLKKKLEELPPPE